MKNIFPEIWNRSKILWFILFKRKELLNHLLNDSLSKNKIFLFLTMDLEYHPLYDKNFRKFSYDGFRNYLSIIERYKIPSTFFVQGEFVEEYKEDIKELFDRGNEIGSHGYWHINLGPTLWWRRDIKSNSLSLRKKSIVKNHKLLSKLIGISPVSFRAPFFSIDSLTFKILERCRYKIDSSLDNGLFGLPSIPYHPSSENILNIGDLKINEFCYTTSSSNSFWSKFEFQRIKFLEHKDWDKDIEIVKECKKLSPFIVINVHSWEFSDKFFPNIEVGTLFSNFIRTIKKGFDPEFLNISDILSLTS